MEENWPVKPKKGFAFLELAVVLIIILILWQVLLNWYTKRTSLDKESSKILSEQGINITNYKAIADTAREKIKDIQKRQAEESGLIK